MKGVGERAEVLSLLVRSCEFFSGYWSFEFARRNAIISNIIPSLPMVLEHLQNWGSALFLEFQSYRDKRIRAFYLWSLVKYLKSKLLQLLCFDVI